MKPNEFKKGAKFISPMYHQSLVIQDGGKEDEVLRLYKSKRYGKVFVISKLRPSMLKGAFTIDSPHAEECILITNTHQNKIAQIDIKQRLETLIQLVEHKFTGLTYSQIEKVVNNILKIQSEITSAYEESLKNATDWEELTMKWIKEADLRSAEAKAVRVYAVRYIRKKGLYPQYSDCVAMNNESFIDIATKQNTVYTMAEYQDKFNSESMVDTYIRFI